MFDNPYIIILALSILVILSYLYIGIAAKTKVPSVLLLLFTGIIARIAFDYFGYPVPEMNLALQILGIVGVILIVLEGALDLEIARDKLGLIIKAFFSALIILIVSALTMAYGIQLVYPQFSFQLTLVNAIPIAVISSAIAIPSVGHFTEEKREFIIYESIFSDILGIVFFNMAVTNDKFTMHTLSWFAIDFSVVIVFSIIFSILMIMFINKTSMNIKFFLTISLLIFLYASGKLIHFSSLLMILFFGIILNNIEHIHITALQKLVQKEKLFNSLNQFRMITNETAFVIRTFFFFIFGFTLKISILFDAKLLLTGVVILIILYGLRYLFLRFVVRREIFPELFVAPRGLITILLFYAIPPEFDLGFINEGLLFFVILASSIIMMIALMKDSRGFQGDIIFRYDLFGQSLSINKKNEGEQRDVNTEDHETIAGQ
jgi:NhaP-type Na+/H+ or K+/H+ antiporter